MTFDLNSGNEKIACHECDLLIELTSVKLAATERMECPRCKQAISAGHDSPVETVIALSVTAIIALIISCCYPFISFAAQGQSRAITLLQTSSELYFFGFPLLAILVFCFILLLPFLYLALLIALLVPIKLGASKNSTNLNGWQPFFIRKIIGKLISYLLPWSMAEVFLIGVLVALIKIVGMADVVLGLSFWAYVIFVPLFIYITSVVDNHRLWHWVENGR